VRGWICWPKSIFLQSTQDKCWNKSKEKGFGPDPKAILESDEREMKYSSKESKISVPTKAKREDWI
jgi:hypothetical protein